MTALIAQLRREQQAAEDRAIFDAYRNGGEFKGQRVDDARITEYIRSRRDTFSRDDPLYDQWNNTLVQTEFSIGEQKIGLAFKEGRVEAGAVAAFYRDQLKNLTPDSDFYREVAGRAAEWAKAAAASARAAAGARLRKQIEAAEKRAGAIIEGFQSIDAALERAAREAGIIAGNQDLTDANASALFDLIDRGVMGADGTPITYSEWQSAAVSSWQAQGTVIDLRKQADAAYKELQDQREKFMSNYLVRLNAADDRQKYEAARETWLDSVAEAQGDPTAIIEANGKYGQALTAIRDSASGVNGGTQNDPDFIGGLNSEIAAITGNEPTGPTVADLYGLSFSGTPGGIAGELAEGETSDASNTYHDTVRAIANANALAAGTAYLGQAEPGGPLQVIPYPVGGATDPFGRNGLDQSIQPSVEKIGGKQRLVFLQGEPVRAAAYEDANGQPVPLNQVSQKAILRGDIILNTEDAPVLGYTFTGPSGSQSFGVFQPDGSLLFTTQNPFTSGAISADGQTFVVTDAVLEGDRWMPNTAGLVKPMSLNPTAGQIGASLLATGATVSSSDMLRLIDTGAIVNVKPEDRQAIVDRAATESINRHGERGGAYYGGTTQVDQESRRTATGGLLDILNTVRSGVSRDLVPNTSGSPDERALMAPPPPPAPPAPTPSPTLPPAIKPSDPTSPGGTLSLPSEFGITPTSSTPTGDTGTGTTSVGALGPQLYSKYLRTRQANNPYEQTPL